MKTKITLICIALFSLCLGTQAQDFSETIKKEMRFNTPNSKQNLLVIDNVNGGITIEGYAGNTVQLVAEVSIDALNTRALEQGKKEINLGIYESGATLYVYLDSPFTEFNKETGGFSHKNGNFKRNYKHKIELKIKVPKNTNLEVKTMNRGDISVENVQAESILANNLNGAITLEKISGQTHANALNKDITISYVKNPSKKSSYHSLNGDINIKVPSALNADVSFKTLNGSFYTNLPSSSANPKTAVKKSNGSKGVRYKVDKSKNFKLGSGGVALDFNLLNGDLTIKN